MERKAYPSDVSDEEWGLRGSVFDLDDRAVDTPGDLLALLVTPANEQDRDRAQQLTQIVHSS